MLIAPVRKKGRNKNNNNNNNNRLDTQSFVTI